MSDPETLLRAAAGRVDRAALTRVVLALAELARRHVPASARRWDHLLEAAAACAAGGATRDEVSVARQRALDASPELRADGGDGSAAARYAAIALAATYAASAEADQPSLLGLSKVSCATELEVCLDHALWGLSEASQLLTDALVDLGGAFVPDAGDAARDRVRDVVDALLCDAIRRSLGPP
jgi:hypothetical protein